MSFHEIVPSEQSWARLKEIVEDIKKLMQEHMLDLSSIERVERKMRSLAFNVPITALMKTGKSTLIDALLGDEFLPWAENPETTRIVRIVHDSGLKVAQLHYQGVLVAEGAANICAHLKAMNKEGRDVPGTVLDAEFVLRAPILSLKDTPFDGVEFHLLDTPGPNEARAEFLREKVESILENSDVLIYLLNSTSLGQEDERKLFELLFSLKKELLTECFQRIFFVVTKVDTLERVSREEIPGIVVNLVKKLCPPEHRDVVKISEDQVLTISAREALLARQVAGPNPSHETQQSYAKIVFGKYGNNKTLEKLRGEVQNSLADTGILKLEDKVLKFLLQNRWTIFMDVILHQFSPCLAELQNYLTQKLNALVMDNSELTDRIAKMQAQIEDIIERFQAAKTFTQQAKQETTNLIKMKLGMKEQCIIEKINMVLEEQPVQNTVTRDRRELAEAQAQVNIRIAKILQDEFALARVALERAAAELLRAQYEELKKPLHSFIAEVEKLCRIRLTDLPYKEFRFEISPPTAAELHKASEEFDLQISQSTATEVKLVERKYCLGAWSTWEKEFVKVDQYQFKPEKLKEKWLAEVTRISARLVAKAELMATHQLNQMVDLAQAELRRYTQLLINAAKQAEEIHQKGEAKTKEEIESLGGHLDILEDLKYQLDAVQRGILGAYNARLPAADNRPNAPATAENRNAPAENRNAPPLPPRPPPVPWVETTSKDAAKAALMAEIVKGYKLRPVAQHKKEDGSNSDSDEDVPARMKRMAGVLVKRLRIHRQ
eukprot:Phypoly_transcript_02910.p1 GENE.Phypoly_transcript_02910~~Phypoly_transcript_02910.p1  ORF type:complete len:777 (+),score=124.52 Phypoly_transcript_02910:243-2573(+)